MHKIHYITLKWKEIKGISSHQVGYLAPGWKTSSTSKLTNWRRMEEESPLESPKVIWKLSSIYYLSTTLILSKYICCFIFIQPKTSCLKITEKVSFNIASEASYVQILSGQKFIKNAINGVKLKRSNETFLLFSTTVRRLGILGLSRHDRSMS